MKHVTSILAVTFMFSTSAFAAQRLTTAEEAQSGGYVSLGNISVTQSGTPTIGHKTLAEAADKKCIVSDVKTGDCYYRVIDKVGNETNHDDINLEVYKK